MGSLIAKECFQVDMRSGLTRPLLERKVWGSEEIVVNNSSYCGKVLTVMPGYACSIHFHAKKLETFHVLTNYLLLEVYELKPENYSWSTQNPQALHLVHFELAWRVRLRAGQSITLNPFVAHRFWSDLTCVFMEVSTHDDPADSYRLELSGPTPSVAPGTFLDHSYPTVSKR